MSSLIIESLLQVLDHGGGFSFVENVGHLAKHFVREVANLFVCSSSSVTVSGLPAVVHIPK